MYFWLNYFCTASESLAFDKLQLFLLSDATPINGNEYL